MKCALKHINNTEFKMLNADDAEDDLFSNVFSNELSVIFIFLFVGFSWKLSFPNFL